MKSQKRKEGEHMTYREKILNILNQDIDLDTDSVEKLVYIAYMMGREKADREVSDLYNSHLAEQRKRAAPLPL